MSGGRSRIDVDVIADRPADIVAIGVGEQNLISVILGLPGLVRIECQRELPSGLHAAGCHGQHLQAREFRSIQASLISMLAVAWIVTCVPSRALISPWFLTVRSGCPVYGGKW